MCDQLVGAGIVGADDEGGDELPPLAIVAAGDGNVGHAGMREQGGLDALRPDVLAAADDQVVAAALDPEVALVVEAAEVAGVQPAVGVSAAGATVGPRTRISPSSIADLGAGQRPAGGADAIRAPRPGPSVQTCEQASVRP